MLQYIHQQWGVGVHGTEEWIPLVAYGRLEQVIECVFSSNRALGRFSATKRLFALIAPIDVPPDSDATKEIVSYKKMRPTIALDLVAIEAVVGQFTANGRQIIIDRSEGLVKPEIVPSAVDEDDE